MLINGTVHNYVYVHFYCVFDFECVSLQLAIILLPILLERKLDRILDRILF